MVNEVRETAVVNLVLGDKTMLLNFPWPKETVYGETEDQGLVFEGHLV